MPMVQSCGLYRVRLRAGCAHASSIAEAGLLHTSTSTSYPIVSRVPIHQVHRCTTCRPQNLDNISPLHISTDWIARIACLFCECVGFRHIVQTSSISIHNAVLSVGSKESVILLFRFFRCFRCCHRWGLARALRKSGRTTGKTVVAQTTA